MKRLIKKSEQEFIVGDKVIYKTHPYDNITPYTVEEILADGSYFIKNEETAYTGIKGRNLEKLNP